MDFGGTVILFSKIRIEEHEVKNMKQTKSLAVLALVLTVFALPISNAQSLGAQETATAEADADVDPGIAPDNLFYGLDVALDRLALALTFGAEAKSEKALEIARERLAEVRRMLEQRKDEFAQRAAAEHESFMAEAESNVELPAETQTVEPPQATESGPQEEPTQTVEPPQILVESAEQLEVNAKLESKLEKHLEKIAQLKAQFSEKQKILDKIEKSAEKFEAKLQVKEQKIAEKLKSKGFSEEQIEEKIAEANEKAEAKIEEKAAVQIEKAKDAIEDAKKKIGPDSKEAKLLEKAEKKLATAEQSIENDKSGKAFGQAKAAEKLAVNAGRQAEKNEAEISASGELKIEAGI